MNNNNRFRTIFRRTEFSRLIVSTNEGGGGGGKLNACHRQNNIIIMCHWMSLDYSISQSQSLHEKFIFNSIVKFGIIQL